MLTLVAEEQRPLQSAADSFNKGLRIKQIGQQENQRRISSGNFQENQEESPFMAYEMNLSVVPEIKIESEQFEVNVEAKGEDKDDDDELFSSDKDVEASLELGSGKSASGKEAEDLDYPQEINNDTSIIEMVQDFLAIETDINGTREGQSKYTYRKKPDKVDFCK